jgi:type I site-specific restriction-modification system R (restriction) subunit
MTTGGGGDPDTAGHRGGFSELGSVERPAIELFRSLGWDHAHLYQETIGLDGSEGRRSMREAVLPNRFWTALQRLNPHLPSEALRDAASRFTRDRSAMVPTGANAEVVNAGSKMHRLAGVKMHQAR